MSVKSILLANRFHVISQYGRLLVRPKYFHSSWVQGHTDNDSTSQPSLDPNSYQQNTN